MKAIVVQLGLATMPLGMLSSAPGLTSDTTRGTSGSMRQAEELSITVAPAAATRGASAFAVTMPAENRAMSMPDQSAVSASSTTTSSPCQGSVRPAERGEAKYLISPTGNERSASTERITPPTCPVAPTTPTRTCELMPEGYGAERMAPQLGWRRQSASSKAACRLWTACSIWSSRTTHDVRIADVEIISMLMPPPARTSNMVAATPGLDFMPAPTMLTRAMSRSDDTPVAPISAARRWQTSVPVVRSFFGTVNEMSVTPWSDTFCTIMSTLTPTSASSRNRRAAMPGLSGTPDTVTFASLTSWVTAETIACSIDLSSSVIQVPGSQVKAERTCSLTPHRRANSTERIAGLGQPVAVISSTSSNDTWAIRRASGTSRGSAVNTPGTSV